MRESFGVEFRIERLSRGTLERVLSEVRDGLIQVPEFQREVVLKPLWIAELLASTSLGYPIGAVTLLAAGNPDYHFAARPVSGAPFCDRDPLRFLVDGQHRVSALYQGLAPVLSSPTDDSVAAFYMDMNLALDNEADRSDAVVWDVLQQAEERNLFPLNLVFGTAADVGRWEESFLENSRALERRGRASLFDEFNERVLPAFRQYRLPTILLDEAWTGWTIRVRAGQNGRSLREEYRHG